MKQPGVVIIIPARLGSTRFKRKVLASVDGKPLLFHVWRRAKQSKLADRVVVATDSEEIARAASGFGAEVIRTAKRHKTGSDRAAEVARKFGGRVIVNWQGDTLGISGKTVDRAIATLKSQKSIGVVTLACRITDDGDLHNPNVVKVVCDTHNRAMAFSRSLIPFVRKPAGRWSRPGWRDFKYLHHIGIYVFRRETLLAFTGWPRTPLEKAESLEQMRILENGEAIQVVTTTARPASIDSPEDLENWSRRYI